jgi:hypothetical protein
VAGRSSRSYNWPEDVRVSWSLRLERECTMKASLGDSIEVRGPHVGVGSRQGVIIEVRGADGTPPFVVRWSDGHQGLFFPGPDATVMPVATSRAEPAS